MYENIQLHIDGIWRSGAENRTKIVVNPATEEEIGLVAVAERVDVDNALSAAAKGFQAWRAVSAFERSRILRRAGDLLRERSEDIARLLTLEQGKPIAEARAEIVSSADILDWFGDEGRRAYGRTVPARDPGVLQLVAKEPVGPVAAFTPWNFPVHLSVRKLAAALAAGCSVILKGPEETPASCAAVVGVLVDAGFPRGTLNLVYGDPAAISDQLISHPTIRKISFTGSTAVGKHLAALAGRFMKPVTMELGGHAPVLVFRDADIDRTVEIMSAQKFRNAGQICVAPTRFLIEESIYPDIIEKFAAAADAIHVGDGLAPNTTMGPLANDRRLEAMGRFVEDAVGKGARLRSGGSRLGNRGYFFAPTILADVPLDAEVMNEEPFGPLAVFRPFSGLEDALTEANRLPYGLAAYAFTRSQATVSALSSRLEAGMISINHYGLALPETPFGGVKESGIGSESGAEALDGYLVTKFITQMQD